MEETKKHFGEMGSRDNETSAGKHAQRLERTSRLVSCLERREKRKSDRFGLNQLGPNLDGKDATSFGENVVLWGKKPGNPHRNEGTARRERETRYKKRNTKYEKRETKYRENQMNSSVIVFFFKQTF